MESRMTVTEMKMKIGIIARTMVKNYLLGCTRSNHQSLSVFSTVDDCKEDEYKCSSGTCIPERYLCDNFPNDCENNEDESMEMCGKQEIIMPT